ncbi:MAG TPA: sugar phosphate nucleotidyltransferase, partial [Chloroflexota bacterium]|nr:sugar phosphate nucleotidyltransferase [Chloroflexota bacterium]
NFLVEPAQRGTAAALALAALAVAERDPAGVMASVHADSLILDAEEFGRTLQAALQVAGSGDHLVVMGITPTTPATQLGYIQRGERIGSANGYAVHQVRQFVEKPDRLTAERYLASGEYLWNPGVFAWRAAAFLRRVEVLMPDLWAPLRGAWAERGTGAEAAALERAYARAPAQAVEYGVIERTPNVVVIPARFRWSDIGDWGELLQVLPKDADGNVVRGDHLGIDTHRCLVLGSGRMVVTIGLEDLVVVETPDALLVCPRSRTQEVKQVVELLRTRGRVDLV